MFYIMNRVWFQNYQPGQGPWDGRLKYRCTFFVIKCLNSVGLNATLFNLMGLAIDHLMTITRPLEYPAIMKTKKVIIMICALWLTAIFAGFTDFFSGIPKYAEFKMVFNYCELIWITMYNDEYLTFALAFVCLVVMLFIYIKIFLVIRQTQNSTLQNYRQSTEDQRKLESSNRRNPDVQRNAESLRNRQISPDNRRNKKPLITTLCILFSFVICWLPMCLFQITLIIVVRLNPAALQHIANSLKYADQYLYDLVLLNCIIDPIIYAVRMYEVQLGYRRLFRKCGIMRYRPARRGSPCRAFRPVPPENRNLVLGSVKRLNVLCQPVNESTT